MTIELKSETAARLADLARRLGFDGPEAGERVIQMALDDLEAKAASTRRKMTPEEKAAEIAYWTEVGKRNRERYPYDDDNPPSKVWQEELYDQQGLPK